MSRGGGPVGPRGFRCARRGHDARAARGGPDGVWTRRARGWRLVGRRLAAPCPFPAPARPRGGREDLRVPVDGRYREEGRNAMHHLVPRHPARPAAHRAATRALLVLAVLALTAARPTARLDKSWVAPGFQPGRVFNLAVLPVCRIAGDAAAGRQVATGWLDRMRRVGVLKMDDVEVFMRLGRWPRERDSVLAVLSKEVYDSGRPGDATARWLARRLGVAALVALRLDRWEAGTGSTDMAYVDVTAALVDSSGKLLWRTSGGARAEAEREPTRLKPDPVSVAPGASHYTGGSGGTTSAGSSSGSSGGSSSGTSSG